jgi:hypothetical protein
MFLSHLFRSETVPHKRHFLLTAYLPLSSSAHLPIASMYLQQAERSLACVARATRINAPAT